MLGHSAKVLADIANVSHRFFGRVGGTSPSPWQGLNTAAGIGDSPARVEENLARVRFQIGVSRQNLFTLKQVHGAKVVHVSGDEDRNTFSEREADALITSMPDIAVGVRTADCIPVLFSSLDGRAVAAAHAGWRGLLAGVLENTVAAFGEYEVKAEELVAVIGPCISQKAFEVGPEVVAAFAKCAVDLSSFIQEGRGDRSHIDLRGAAACLLKSMKVGAVDQLDECTYSQSDRFFSFRADKRTGRQVSVIARTSPPIFDPETFA